MHTHNIVIILQLIANSPQFAKAIASYPATYLRSYTHVARLSQYRMNKHDERRPQPRSVASYIPQLYVANYVALMLIRQLRRLIRLWLLAMQLRNYSYMQTYVAKYRGRRFYSTVSKTGFRGFDGFDQFITCQATCLQVSRLQLISQYLKNLNLPRIIL